MSENNGDTRARDRQRKRPNNYMNVGQEGRKTGFKPAEDLERDQYGMADPHAFFRSPQPAKDRIEIDPEFESQIPLAAESHSSPMSLDLYNLPVSRRHSEAPLSSSKAKENRRSASRSPQLSDRDRTSRSPILGAPLPSKGSSAQVLLGRTSATSSVQPSPLRHSVRHYDDELVSASRGRSSAEGLYDPRVSRSLVDDDRRPPSPRGLTRSYGMDPRLISRGQVGYREDDIALEEAEGRGLERRRLFNDNVDDPYRSRGIHRTRDDIRHNDLQPHVHRDQVQIRSSPIVRLSRRYDDYEDISGAYHSSQPPPRSSRVREDDELEPIARYSRLSGSMTAPRARASLDWQDRPMPRRLAAEEGDYPLQRQQLARVVEDDYDSRRARRYDDYDAKDIFRDEHLDDRYREVSSYRNPRERISSPRQYRGAADSAAPPMRSHDLRDMSPERSRQLRRDPARTDMPARPLRDVPAQSKRRASYVPRVSDVHEEDEETEARYRSGAMELDVENFVDDLGDFAEEGAEEVSARGALFRASSAGGSGGVASPSVAGASQKNSKGEKVSLATGGRQDVTTGFVQDNDTYLPDDDEPMHDRDTEPLESPPRAHQASTRKPALVDRTPAPRLRAVDPMASERQTKSSKKVPASTIVRNRGEMSPDLADVAADAPRRRSMRGKKDGETEKANGGEEDVEKSVVSKVATAKAGEKKAGRKTAAYEDEVPPSDEEAAGKIVSKAKTPKKKAKEFVREDSEVEIALDHEEQDHEEESMPSTTRGKSKEPPSKKSAELSKKKTIEKGRTLRKSTFKSSDDGDSSSDANVSRNRKSSTPEAEAATEPEEEEEEVAPIPANGKRGKKTETADKTASRVSDKASTKKGKTLTKEIEPPAHEQEETPLAAKRRSGRKVSEAEEHNGKSAKGILKQSKEKEDTIPGAEDEEQFEIDDDFSYHIDETDNQEAGVEEADAEPVTAKKKGRPPKSAAPKPANKGRKGKDIADDDSIEKSRKEKAMPTKILSKKRKPEDEPEQEKNNMQLVVADGEGRSRRTRIPPLEYWRNERVKYALRKSLTHGIIPEVQAIVRIPKDESDEQRPMVKHHRTVNHSSSSSSVNSRKRPKTMGFEYVEPDEEALKEFEKLKKDFSLPVRDFETGEVEVMTVGCPKELIHPTIPLSSSFGGPLFQRTFGLGEFFGTGFVFLRKGDVKGRKNTLETAVARESKGQVAAGNGEADYRARIDTKVEVVEEGQEGKASGESKKDGQLKDKGASEAPAEEKQAAVGRKGRSREKK
ncbi:hypothetical protein HDU67_005519 [Dinochytrium kinnereticum]|nr:hypothetical protein HDU67_005519 [Dinochytrium kinnereticum]